MNHRIDVAGWQEFRIGELFDIIKGRRLTKANMIDGDINFIGSSSVNNGITALIGNTEHVHPGGVLTVCYNGSVGETFYQSEPFWASDDVNILEPKTEISRNSMLFIGTVIRHLGQYYNWTDKWTRDVMLDTLISLPVTTLGDPDWGYMNTYMTRVMGEMQEVANKLIVEDFGKVAFDVCGWQEFRIGELFDIIKGRRLTKANMIDGDINFIGSSSVNNGITALIGNTEHVHPGGVLTVCYNGSVGETFYQSEPFWASDDVNILEPKTEISRNSMLFIGTVIRHLGQYYNWTDKWTRDVMLDTLISLPVTTLGDPDWGYMNTYMTDIFHEAQDMVSKLEKL